MYSLSTPSAVTLEDAQAAAAGLAAFLPAVITGARSAGDMNMHALMQLIGYVRQQKAACMTREEVEAWMQVNGAAGHDRIGSYENVITIFHKLAQHVASTQQQPPAVPDGWVMVPIELSEDQISSIKDALESEGMRMSTWFVREVHKAMLAAAKEQS